MVMILFNFIIDFCFKGYSLFASFEFFLPFILSIQDNGLCCS
jgi:hypothetical protein